MSEPKRICKNQCIKYKATRPANGSRYGSGQVRCQRCEIFINWDGLWCPCCNYRLRLKPRNTRLKEKFFGRVEMEVPTNGM